MNRREFMEQLKQKLNNLPFDEVREAVDFYEQYFDDAGPEQEQAVLAGLGSPSEVASQIIADSAVKRKPEKRGLAGVFTVILAIFASPIALPIAVAAVAVALALVVVVIALVLSVGVTGLALLAGGMVSVASGVMILGQSFATAVFYVGAGLVGVGAGLPVAVFAGRLSRVCFAWLSKRVGRFIIGRRAVK